MASLSSGGAASISTFRFSFCYYLNFALLHGFFEDLELPDMAKQQAPSGCGQIVVRHDVPSPWNTPPCVVQSVSLVTTMHVPSSRQQAPDAAAGVKATVSFGKRVACPVFSRLLNRRAVTVVVSSPSMIQPKLDAGSSSHCCTFATRSGVDVQE